MATTGSAAQLRSGLMGGIAISLAAAVWMLLAPVLGHMGPPWPCAIAGALIVVCSGMALYRPTQHAGWGVLIVAVSAAVMLLGSGGILPGLLGALGGAATIVSVIAVQKSL
jgi:hypothetical protein